MDEISEQNVKHRAAHPSRRRMRERLARRRPQLPRIAFVSKGGKVIVRETQPGSEHERRLLKRCQARYLP